ncbi:unnamed protein product [Porites lobata]|uniref:Uncharacterized protein n=1 Tax=Porites lobata TaxID=104759 RepID=A0ABN8R8I0_9CNID|nr:unnamed protein product [Porites lobata]
MGKSLTKAIKDCFTTVADLLTLDSGNHKQKIREFETKIQALATRLDSARVYCDEKATDYGNVYFANVVGSIMSFELT